VASFDDGALHVDFDQRQVSLNGNPLDLDPPEYNVLALLVRNVGQIVPFDELNEAIHDGADEAIRDGAEGERLQVYQLLQDGTGGWRPVWYSLCQKLGFSVGEAPIGGRRPLAGLGYRVKWD